MQNAPVPQGPAKFRFNLNVFTSGFLALVALLASGVFLSEYVKHSEYADREEQNVLRAEKDLKSFAYDAAGNVAPNQRARHQTLIREVEGAKHVRRMRDTATTELMISGGSLLAFVILGALAFRAGKS